MSSSRNNPALTGIRGVAAFWVYWHHVLPLYVLLAGTPIRDRFLRAITEQGFRGVDLFFVLSGFILMYVHAEDFVLLRWRNVRRFFLLRVFRVYPVHLAVLGGIVVLVALLPAFRLSERNYFPAAFSLHALWRTALLVQNWAGFNNAIWNAPAWTLSAEMLGYLAFPALAWVVVKMRHRFTPWVAAMGLLAFLLLVMLYKGIAFENQWGGYGLVRMAFEFSAGICLCQYFRLAGSDSRFVGLLTNGAALGVVLCCVVFPAVASVAPVLFACLIVGLAYRRTIAYRVCASRPVEFMGEISYSFYLVHWIVVHWMLWLCVDHIVSRATGMRFVEFGWAGCIALAYLLYCYIEVPGRRLGRRLIKWLGHENAETWRQSPVERDVAAP